MTRELEGRLIQFFMDEQENKIKESEDKNSVLFKESLAGTQKIIEEMKKKTVE